MQWLKQDTSVTVRIGPFSDEADGFTAEAGLTISQADIRLSKNGGAFAQTHDNSGATHDENGWYSLTLDEIDTNTLGRLDLAIHESGARPVRREFMVVPANVWDSFFGADQLQVDAGAIADAVWDEVLTAATHNVSTSAGRRLRQLGAASIASGTAEAGTGDSVTLETGEVSAVDHIYNQNLIAITGGAGAGQVRMIVEYVGSTRVATVDEAWQTNPDATSEYQIIAFSGVLLAQHGRAVAGTASTIALSATALTDDGSYVGSGLVITTGTGAGQMRLITGYVGSTKVATVSPDWEVTPDATSIYKILPVGRSIVESLGAVARLEVNTEVGTTLNTAIPGSPTADSISERVKAIDDKLPSSDYLRGTADPGGGMDTADKADVQAEVEDALETRGLHLTTTTTSTSTSTSTTTSTMAPWDSQG